MVSTASTAIWTIAAQGCPPHYVNDCANDRGFLFLTNKSLTWTPNSIYQTGLEANLGRDSSGYTGFDKATLGWQGSNTATNDHAIIWNLADSKYWLGVFGMNPRPTNFSTFNDPQTSFMQTLYNRKIIPSLTYGYTAGNGYRFSKVFGSLTLGGYDANRFEPNGISFDFYPDISRDLSVNLHAITTDSTTPSDLLPAKSISIFIDSTVPEIWLPRSACTAFERAFGIEYDETSKRYLISPEQRAHLLGQDASVTFTIGPNAKSGSETINITLPYKAFDLEVSFPIVANTSHYFPLQRAANDTQYTLGRTFLQEAYLFANYENQNFSVSACKWDERKVQDQHIVSVMSPRKSHRGEAVNSKDHAIPIAEIAGIAAGGFALIVTSVILLCIFTKHRRQRQDGMMEKLRAKELEIASRPAMRRYISHPIGGELGGGAVFEMPLGPKVMPPELTSQHGQNEMAAGQYYTSGKYHRYSVAEMGATNAVYEMAGSEVSAEADSRTARTARIETRPKVPPKVLPK